MLARLLVEQAKFHLYFTLYPSSLLTNTKFGMMTKRHLELLFGFLYKILHACDRECDKVSVLDSESCLAGTVHLAFNSRSKAYIGSSACHLICSLKMKPSYSGQCLYRKMLSTTIQTTSTISSKVLMACSQESTIRRAAEPLCSIVPVS